MNLAGQQQRIERESKVVDDCVADGVGGMLGRIAWVTPFDNMAAFELAATKLMTDADYLKLVESSEPYFVPGSVHDEVWTSVPQGAGLA